MKVSTCTRGSAISSSTIAAGSPVTRCSHPAGSPASAKMPTRAPADSGVRSEGLSTTGQPAARAGPSLCATRFSGKLNGVMAPTTPAATGRVKAAMFSPVGTTPMSRDSPWIRFASAAESSNVCTHRATSPRAAVIGLPASCCSRCARVSVRSSTRAAARRSTAARRCAGRPAR